MSSGLRIERNLECHVVQQPLATNKEAEIKRDLVIVKEHRTKVSVSMQNGLEGLPA